MAIPNSWQDRILPKRYSLPLGNLKGAINGTNKVFNADSVDFLDPTRTHVYLNGVMQDDSQYAIFERTVTLIAAPQAGDSLLIVA